MATKITSANFAPAILAAIVGPAISSVQIASDNTFATTLDDNAVPLAGGYIVLNGTGFITGCQVYLDSTIATTVTFVSNTRINVQVPALAAGTYVIYLVNGDGSIAIRVNGLTYSASPAWSTASDLGSVLFGTAVSLQLAAPSDSTITYTLQAGSTLPTGLTLSSAGLLSGTVTVESATTYNFNVVATDVELQDSPRTFSVSITLGDVYFKNTVLLLNGETATTNWIADASTNSFNITPVSSVTIAKPSAFSPYNTSWSNYFDGTGDYLTTTGAALDTGAGTSDFTMECWVYNNGYSGSQYGRGIFTFYPAAGYANSRIMFRLNNGGDQINIFLYISGTIHANITSTVLATPGAWTHVAYIRQSGTFKLYINGTIESSMTVTGVSASLSTFDKFDIGRNQDGNLPDFNGYISNFRYVKGTAVYTANFTPPTASLTAVANTVLLTCQSNRFKDNSTNNFTLTPNGDVAVKTFGPFVDTDTVTGSGYFYSDDNNAYGNQYLQTSGGGINLTGTSTFTIEAWIYPRVRQAGAYGVIIGDTLGAGGTENWSFGVTTAGLLNLFWYQAGDKNCTGSTTLPLNSWGHVAISISTGVIKLFVNGAVETLSGTTTTTAPGSSLGYYVIGRARDTTKVFLGNIADLRVVTNTALYTAAFTPPTAALTAVANTSLLTLQNRIGHNNNTALDTSGNKLLGTKFGNATQGTFSPFSQAGWSNYFDGSGDYVQIPSSANLSPGSVFTFEAWIYIPAIVDSFNIYAAATNSEFQVGFNGASAWGIATRGTAWVLTSTTLPIINQWNHIVVSRGGTGTNQTSLFLNGVRVANGTVSAAYSGTSAYQIAANGAGAGVWTGYISNLRLVRGVDVYGYTNTTITVPTVALTAVTNTALLTCQNNRFIDNSTNNFTITATGDTRVQAFSPFKPTASYDLATNSGSGYYDGTGDYHSFPLVLTNVGNFTFEFWAYSTTSSISGLAICGSSEFEVYLSGLNISWVYQGLIAFSSGFNFIPGQWNHIVICRYNWVLNAAGLFKMFVNGQMYSHATAKGENMPIPGPFITGGSYYTNAFRTPWPGYISNVRFINGNGTIYTAAFTPPTAPVTATNDTVLQLNFTNAGVIDQSGRNDLETVGDARISTSVKKYGTGSMVFDGTGDYLFTRTNPALAFESGDFTIEFWINFSSTSGRQDIVWWVPDNDSLRGGISWQLSGAALCYYDAAAGAVINAAWSPAINTWYHIALTRSSTTSSLFIDGTSVGTYGTIRPYVSSYRLYIGKDSAAESSYVTGYIDDFRITKGVARYTANFTPPTAAITK